METKWDSIGVELCKEVKSTLKQLQFHNATHVQVKIKLLNIVEKFLRFEINSRLL